MRIFSSLCSLLLIVSCITDRDDAVPGNKPCNQVTFTSDIYPLIQTRCAISGCHVSGFAMGDFSTYDSLKVKIDNGKFNFRVLETKSMPPLDVLSLADLEKIQCWLSLGADNN